MPSSSTPRFQIEKPFTALQNGTWLRNRPKEDVYQLLTDTFRMRREDQYKFVGNVQEGSIHAGGSSESESKNFRSFLENVVRLDARKSSDKKLLPTWWTAGSLEECVSNASTNRDANVGFAVEKHAIQEFYGQNDMPMQLRMLGEALDGTMTAGQSGAQMLQMRAAIESGGGQMMFTHLG